MRRGTKYAWGCFAVNSLAMFIVIGAGQTTGIEELNRAAIGLAWSELALIVIGTGTWAYNSCYSRATPTTQTAAMSNDLELSSQETVEKAPTPLAENKPVLTTALPGTTRQPPCSATYTPVRRVSV